MSRSIESIAEKRRKWVQANRENGFESGLKRLLTELYPDNAHFVYELLQNAEDACANEARFILHEDRLEFEHNGDRLFSIADVEAITSIGFSTKRDDATNIGKFGVGFKAVYSYTETPQIHSGDYNFSIRDMVVPELSEFAREQPFSDRTQFILPFDSAKKAPQQAQSEIQRLLKTLGATTVLFLTNIHKVEYLLPDSSRGYIERIELDGNRFEVRVQQPNEIAPSSTWFLRFSKVVEIEDEEVENREDKKKSCRIALAFELVPAKRNEGFVRKSEEGNTANVAPEWELAPMEPGRICIYFPAEKETSNLRFHLHAPFASTVARDSVRDSTENLILRNHLADLLAESLSVIRDQGLLTVRALGLLPNDKESLPEFIKPFMDRLILEFKEKKLVPMKSGGHAAADGIFRGTKPMSDLIGDEDLATLLGDGYVPPIWAANPPQRNQREDNFLSMLGITHWDLGALVRALIDLNEEALHHWLSGKDNEWLQNLFEMLLLDYINKAPKYPHPAASDRIKALEQVAFVRCSDQIYRKGRDCFFPTDEFERDDKFPRVAMEVLADGKEENEKVRVFLEKVGVRAVDEYAHIEYILRERYSQEVVDGEKFAPEIGDIELFVEYARNYPDNVGIFENHSILKLENGEWATPNSVYLDMPYMDTGLRDWFGTQGDATKTALSADYLNCALKTCEIADFAKALGAWTTLEIKKTTAKKNPDWNYLSKNGGDRNTQTGRDEDYSIPGLKEFLEHPSVSKSRLVWRTMRKACASTDCPYLKAHYGRNASRIVFASSILVHDLREVDWVPQGDPDQPRFVRPRDAVAEKLPEDFVFQTGWQWLKELKFGEGISQADREKRETLRDLGFESLEEAEEMAKLKKEDPDGYRRWRDSQQAKPAFPERPSSDPERRKAKAEDTAAGAPAKNYEKRKRSVRTTRSQGREGVDEYLRDFYTNDEDQLICQICHEEMPFRKKNGRHYFEKVEAFDLPKEQKPNYLALCPVCAARFKEFVVNDTDRARKNLREAFAQMDGTLELPVTLGEENAIVRFVETHAIDLRETLSDG